MVYINFFPQHYWYCSLFCLIELTASVNNFVSRQSQCTRWRRKSKEGKTKRRSQNLISLSLRKNPSRNHRRKRLRLTSSLWRALGRWPQFWRLKETCCNLHLAMYLSGWNQWKKCYCSVYWLWDKDLNDVTCAALICAYYIFQILFGCGLQVISIDSRKPSQRKSWKWTTGLWLPSANLMPGSPVPIWIIW